MGPSIPQLLLILLVIVIIFGAGRLPRVMGDIGKGVKALKKGLKEGEEDVTPTATPKVEDKTTQEKGE